MLIFPLHKSIAKTYQQIYGNEIKSLCWYLGFRASNQSATSGLNLPPPPPAPYICNLPPPPPPPPPPQRRIYASWIGSALVHIIACRLFGTKLLSKSMLGYSKWGPSEQTSIKFCSKYKTFRSRRGPLSIDVIQQLVWDATHHLVFIDIDIAHSSILGSCPNIVYENIYLQLPTSFVDCLFQTYDIRMCQVLMRTCRYNDIENK